MDNDNLTKRLTELEKRLDEYEFRYASIPRTTMRKVETSNLNFKASVNFTNMPTLTGDNFALESQIDSSNSAMERTVGDLSGDNLTNFANNWQSFDIIPAEKWNVIAMSADGRYQTACTNNDGTYNGTIYRSTDYGRTFTGFYSASDGTEGRKVDFTSVSMSDDGMFQLACTSNFDTYSKGHLYLSENRGANWRSYTPTEYWSSVAISGDGKHMFAVALDSKKIYTSTNGSTWVSSEIDEVDSINSIAMSKDGKYLTILGTKTTDGNIDHLILRSTDLGSPVPVSNDVGTGNHSWTSLAVSSTGRYQMACCDSDNNNKGALLQSSNFGETWSKHTNAVSDNQDSICVAMSGTGQFRLLSISDESLKYSNDFGVTWNNASGGQHTGAYGAAISSSGRYYASVKDGSGIKVGSTVRNLIPVADTEPANPETGSVYFNTDDEQLNVYDGANWKTSATNLISVATTAPTDPVNGSVFFDTDTSTLNVYNGGWKWVTLT